MNVASSERSPTSAPATGKARRASAGADIIPIAAATAPALSISVIMPVYNAAHFLRETLPPLIAMRDAGEVLEVIAVDDGSTDGSAELAAELGARVIPSGGRLGPGGARNVAAQLVSGDVLWFVDSDVIAHAGGAHWIRASLADADTVAVFGSYDDRPTGGNFGSQYKNLVHHHYHHRSRAEASSFWAGCGAIRRDAFAAIGGFDAARYKMPSIEDIELGYRLRDQGGRIRLEKRLLSTHLKFWTVKELVRVDVLRRAVPWSRLMLSREGVVDDLNVTWAERVRAGLAGLAVLAIAAAVLGLVSPWLALAATLVTFVANYNLFKLFARRHGIGFAIAGSAFHQLYYLYSTAAFVWCWLENKLERLMAKPA